MKKLILLVLTAFALSGCGSDSDSNENIVATIDMSKYTFTTYDNFSLSSIDSNKWTEESTENAGSLAIENGHLTATADKTSSITNIKQRLRGANLPLIADKLAIRAKMFVSGSNSLSSGRGQLLLGLLMENSLYLDAGIQLYINGDVSAFANSENNSGINQIFTHVTPNTTHTLTILIDSSQANLIQFDVDGVFTTINLGSAIDLTKTWQNFNVGARINEDDSTTIGSVTVKVEEVWHGTK